jgi:Glycosyltransferase family 87
MSAVGQKAVAEAHPLGAPIEPRVSLARVLSFAAIVFFGVLPALTVIVLFVSAIRADEVAMDFRQFYAAAETILRGGSPYLPSGAPLTAWGGPYPYPPLPAEVAAPLTALPLDVAGVLLMTVLVVVALAVPATLGVRDWRCYGLLLLWPPVISAIQTGNVTLWFALAAAIAWRFRDRVAPVTASLALTLAAKFFLWPLVVWLAATRRVATALWTCALGAGLLVVSWSVIGFAGFLDYPNLLRKLEDTVGGDSYTAYIVGLDLGLPSVVARGAWLAIGVAVLAWAVVVARRGDERTAFILAVAASLALTPIVWLHYFALLSVVVALAQPRLGLVWFVPLGMFLTPGSGHPTTFQTSWTLVVAILTVVLAVRRSARLGDGGRSWAVQDPVPAADSAA